MNTVKRFFRNLKNCPCRKPNFLKKILFIHLDYSKTLWEKNISDFFSFYLSFPWKIVMRLKSIFFCAKYSLSKFPKGLFQYSPFFPNQRWFNMRDCCSRGRLLVKRITFFNLTLVKFQRWIKCLPTSRAALPTNTQPMSCHGILGISFRFIQST